jgi:hypothetical protein
VRLASGGITALAEQARLRDENRERLPPIEVERDAVEQPREAALEALGVERLGERSFVKVSDT